MCVIIERKPGFNIPFEDFESAVHVNPDGYGIAYPDNGRLVVLRSGDKPDPAELYRLINEELIDKQLLIHLRFTTVGETNTRNAHPFPVLEYKTDGIDLRMAHNGTISKYRPGKEDDSSDTRHFVKTFVRPLFKRLIKGMSSKELLSDSFVRHLLEDQIPKGSVLSFLDGEGNTLTINETGNGGKREDEWYYSNTYSFNRKHREPEPPKSKVYYPSDDYWGYPYGYGRYGYGVDERKGEKHLVFLWDELRTDQAREQILLGSVGVRKHALALTAKGYLPLYNIGDNVNEHAAFLLQEGDDQLIDLPNWAKGPLLPVVGTVLEVTQEELVDLDYFYADYAEFELVKISVHPTLKAKQEIECYTWVTKPSAMVNIDAKETDRSIRKTLDVTPFSKMKHFEYYKY